MLFIPEEKRGFGMVGVARLKGKDVSYQLWTLGNGHWPAKQEVNMCLCRYLGEEMQPGLLHTERRFKDLTEVFLWCMMWIDVAEEYQDELEKIFRSAIAGPARVYAQLLLETRTDEIKAFEEGYRKIAASYLKAKELSPCGLSVSRSRELDEEWEGYITNEGIISFEDGEQAAQVAVTIAPSIDKADQKKCVEFLLNRWAEKGGDGRAMARSTEFSLLLCTLLGRFGTNIVGMVPYFHNKNRQYELTLCGIGEKYSEEYHNVKKMFLEAVLEEEDEL